MMTEPQKIALSDPCRLACETAQPQFGWTLGKIPASLVLTVNSGYECLEEGFGGPVWHSSVAGRLSERQLEKLAEKCLVGVGDASLGEWRDWTGKAFHIRRRLSAEEQKIVGDVKDIRNTSEAIERLRKISFVLPQAAKNLAVQELGILRYPV